jgi:hypothetical protein
MGTCNDPNKSGSYRVVDRTDWYQVRLYLLALGIVLIPFSLALWLLMEWL